MTTLRHAIEINASQEKIFSILANLEALEKYDPTVLTAKALTAEKTGIGSKRKVMMKDGKNWFEERMTVAEPDSALAFELIACSFPVESLTHSYRLESQGDTTRVHQIMVYKVKHGLFGKILDWLVVRRQSAVGIKKFFTGLKAFAERNQQDIDAIVGS